MRPAAWICAIAPALINATAIQTPSRGPTITVAEPVATRTHQSVIIVTVESNATACDSLGCKQTGLEPPYANLTTPLETISLTSSTTVSVTTVLSFTTASHESGTTHESKSRTTSSLSLGSGETPVITVTVQPVYSVATATPTSASWSTLTLTHFATTHPSGTTRDQCNASAPRTTTMYVTVIAPSSASSISTVTSSHWVDWPLQVNSSSVHGSIIGSYGITAAQYNITSDVTIEHSTQITTTIPLQCTGAASSLRPNGIFVLLSKALGVSGVQKVAGHENHLIVHPPLSERSIFEADENTAMYSISTAAESVSTYETLTVSSTTTSVITVMNGSPATTNSTLGELPPVTPTLQQCSIMTSEVSGSSIPQIIHSTTQGLAFTTIANCSNATMPTALSENASFTGTINVTNVVNSTMIKTSTETFSETLTTWATRTESVRSTSVPNGAASRRDMKMETVYSSTKWISIAVTVMCWIFK